MTIEANGKTYTITEITKKAIYYTNELNEECGVGLENVIVLNGNYKKVVK